MILTLPPRTKQLIDHYLNLRVGNQLIQCPYYQNVTGKKSRPVFIGKGLPEEIEKEVLVFYKHLKKDPNRSRPGVIRYAMIMASLGIDCSGLVIRVLDSWLKEKGYSGIKNLVRPPFRKPIELFRWQFKFFTNISANTLTSNKNCKVIKEFDQILPGDLIRFGKKHVAIIIEVKKKILLKKLLIVIVLLIILNCMGLGLEKFESTNQIKDLKNNFG